VRLLSHRVLRVAQAVKQELAELIQRELSDPRLSFTTVVSVEISHDSRYCRVYLSVPGSPEEQKDALMVLEKTKSFLRGEIGRRLGLKFAPEIAFKLDRSIEHGARIGKLLNEIRKG